MPRFGPTSRTELIHWADKKDEQEETELTERGGAGYSRDFPILSVSSVASCSNASAAEKEQPTLLFDSSLITRGRNPHHSPQGLGLRLLPAPPSRSHAIGPGRPRFGRRAADGRRQIALLSSPRAGNGRPGGNRVAAHFANERPGRCPRRQRRPRRLRQQHDSH